jgi:hypothetical protein
MIYVQSFWSKPFLNADSNEYNYRISGGFLDKRYFYYCWALSFLSLKYFGQKCLLVTDDLGKYLLVEALGFEYDEVQLEFNALENLSSSYWAIPKLHVYKNMSEPFLHFDGDLILYSGFKDLDLGNRDLVFEFKNESFSDDHLKSIKYLDTLLFDEKYQSDPVPGEYSPDELNIKAPNHKDICQDHSNPLKSSVEKSRQQLNHDGTEILVKSKKKKPHLSDTCTDRVYSIGSCASKPTASESSQNHPYKFELGELNCGIIGGRDYRFLNEFASWSLNLFSKNLGKLDSEFLKYNKNLINSYFEQYLLNRFICQNGKAFSCIYEDDPRHLYQRDFFLPVNNPLKIMTHFILNLKVKYSLEIELRLRFDYPEWHARINDLIDRNII